MRRMTYDGPDRRIRHGARVYELTEGEFDAHPADVDALQRVGAELVEEEPQPDAGQRALEDLTVDELRELAREHEIEGRSGMSKQELVSALAEEG